GQLDRRFDRLGAAIAEETLPLEAATFAECLGQQPLRFGVPGVRHMDELAHLLAHRRDDARRTVAEQVAAPPREEIQVALALGSPDQRTLAAHQADGVARVIADDMGLEQVDRLLRVHDFTSPWTAYADGRALVHAAKDNQTKETPAIITPRKLFFGSLPREPAPEGRGEFRG